VTSLIFSLLLPALLALHPVSVFFLLVLEETGAVEPVAVVEHVVGQKGCSGWHYPRHFLPESELLDFSVRSPCGFSGN